MKYLGSKRRIAKYILPIILKDLKPDQYYIEPFVGGANLIDKVNHPYRIGIDIHGELIALLIAIRDGWIPPENISEDEHKLAKDGYFDNDLKLKAFILFCCSFGGMYKTGYARGKTGRNYALESKNNLIKQSESLKGIEFYSCSYDKFEYPDNSLIYCDPPYNKTTGYRDKFDHEKFYDWCRMMKSKGHEIFISEAWMPEDFKLLWESSINIAINNNNITDKRSRIERLYTL